MTDHLLDRRSNAEKPRREATRRSWLWWVTIWTALLLAAGSVAVAAPRAWDRWLLFGAATLSLLGIAHSVIGERFLIKRLLRGDLPRLFGTTEFTRHTLRFAWHLTSLAWWGLAAVLLVLATGSPTPAEIARVIAVAALVSAGIAAVVSRGRHLAWVALLAVGAASWFGSS